MRPDRQSGEAPSFHQSGTGPQVMPSIVTSTAAKSVMGVSIMKETVRGQPAGAVFELHAKVWM